MWQDLMTSGIPMIDKIVRTVAVYTLILLLFRIGGRRSVGQLNSMDLVVMFLLSNVVQNAIIGPDNSLIGGVIGAVTLVLVNNLVDWAAYRWPLVRLLVEGKPLQLVTDGVIRRRELRRLGLRAVDLDHAIRAQNGNDLSEVRTAEFDPGGHILISLKSQDQNATAGDIAALRAQLDRIEQALADRPRAAGR